MQHLALLAAAAMLSSCAVNNQPVPVRPVAGAQTVAWLLGGKTAGPPIRCLPSYTARDMTVLDSQTVAYRDGSARTYVMHLSPGCGEIASGAALVTRSYGTSDLCTGDIAHAMEGTNWMIAGSCSIEAIVPFTRSPRR